MSNVMSKIVTALSVARLYVVISSIVALASFGFGLHFGAMLGPHIMSTLWLSIAIFALAILGVFTVRNAVALRRASWGSIMRIARNAFWGMGILLLDYEAVAFILNRSDGAWLRNMLSKFSVPDGNLLTAADTVDWVFIGTFALLVTFGVGPYIWIGVKHWFGKRFITAQPRAVTVRQPEREHIEHTSARPFHDLNLHHLMTEEDDEEDDADATHDVGAQLNFTH